MGVAPLTSQVAAGQADKGGRSSHGRTLALDGVKDLSYAHLSSPRFAATIHPFEDKRNLIPAWPDACNISTKNEAIDHKTYSSEMLTILSDNTLTGTI
jgi:hypothetical protein